jgi:hypothetical protein
LLIERIDNSHRVAVICPPYFPICPRCVLLPHVRHFFPYVRGVFFRYFFIFLHFPICPMHFPICPRYIMYHNILAIFSHVSAIFSHMSAIFSHMSANGGGAIFVGRISVQLVFTALRSNSTFLNSGSPSKTPLDHKKTNRF